MKLVVVGSGAAGLSSAIAAAKRGVEVAILDKKPSMGGTVANSLIHTIGGLYDSAGLMINPGLPQELEVRLLKACTHSKKRKIGKAWVLDVDPDCYRSTIEKWVGEFKKIKFYPEVSLESLDYSGGLVTSISFKHKNIVEKMSLSAVVDATGTAEVVRLINSELVIDEKTPPLCGLIVSVRGVQPGAVEFPNGWGLIRKLRAAAQDNLLPKEFSTIWVDQGVFPDEVYFKFSISFHHESGLQSELVDRLRIYLKNLEQFQGATVFKIGEVGIREGGRVRGKYELTLEDVKNGKNFSDSVCKGVWPIEYWDPEKGVQLEYINEPYDIPKRSLQVMGFENLWSAGKCLSAEPRAQASARVVGTCWAMGEGVIKSIMGEL